VGKPEKKRPLGRPRRGGGDIEMGLKYVGWGDMVCIDLVHDGDW
jgi:hypothetical protein